MSGKVGIVEDEKSEGRTKRGSRERDREEITFPKKN